MKNKFTFGIRTLLLLILLVTLLPLSGLIVYHFLDDKNRQIEDLQKYSGHLGEIKAEQVSALIDGTKQYLLALAHTKCIVDLNPSASQSLLSQLAEHSPAYANVGVVLSNGNNIAGSKPLTTAVNSSGQHWFERLQKERQFVVGDFQIGRETQKPGITFAYPIAGKKDSGAVAAVYVALKLDVLHEITMHTDLPEGASISIIDQLGTILSRFPDPDLWVGKVSPIFSERRGEIPGDFQFSEKTGVDGKTRLYKKFIVPHSNNQLSVVLGFSKENILSESRQNLFTSMVLIIVVVGLTVFVMWNVSRRLIIRPIEYASGIAQKLAAGEKTARESFTGGVRELRLLIQNFNVMADVLQQNDIQLLTVNQELEKKVQERTAQLESTLNALPDMLFEFGLDGFCYNIHSHQDDYLTKPAMEIIGTNIKTFLHKEAAEIIFSALNEAHEKGYSSGKQYDILFSQGKLSFEISVAPINVIQDQPRFIMLRHDITKRRIAEDALKETLALNQKIIESSSLGIFACRADGPCIIANEAVAQISGAPKEKMLQINFRELQSWKKNGLFEKVETALQSGEEQFAEIHITTTFGKDVWLKYYITTFTSNNQLHFLMLVDDVTKRKQAEDEIRSNEKRLKSLVDILQHQAPSVQGFLDYALDQAIQLTQSKIGYIYFYNEEKQQFVLNTWSKEVMHECRIIEQQTVYDLQKTGLWGEAVRQRKPIIENHFHSPHPLKKGYPEGHAPLHKFLTVPVFNGEQIVGVVGVANKETDYTDADTLQLTLMMDVVWKVVAHKKAEENFKELFEHAPVGYHEIDAMGRIVRINATELSMLGYSTEEMIGQPVWKFAVDEDSSHRAVMAKLSGTVVPSQPFARQYKRKNKSIVSVLVEDKIIKQEDGSISGIRSTIQDVTELHNAEEALRQSERLLIESQQIAGLGTYVLDLATGRWTSSAILDDIFGIDRNHLHSIDAWTELIHPEWRDEITRYFTDEVVAKRQRFDKEYKIVRARNGEPRWVHGLGELELNEKSEPVRMLGTIMDITHRKQADEDLRTSQERLQLATSSGNIGVWDWNIEKNELIWDVSMYTLYGIHQEDFSGAYDAWLKTVHPDDRGYTDGEIHAALQGDREYAPEFRIVRPDGSVRYIKAESKTFRNQDNNAFRMIGVNIDITDRTLAVQAQQESAQFVRTIANNIPGLVAYWTNDLRCAFANKGYLEWFGRTVDQMHGISMQELMGDELFKKNEPYIRAAVRGEAQQFERTLTKANGEIGYTWAQYIPNTKNGKVDGFFVLVTDVTSLKAAENALRESEKKYRALIENSLIGVIQTKMNGEVLYVNDAFIRMYEAESADEFIGIQVASLYKNEDDRNEIIRLLKKDGRVDNFEAVGVTKKGNEKTRLLSVTTSGEVINGLVIDITERKVAEEQLLKLAKDLKRSNVELEQFAYVASHDLQEPLRMIASYTQLLEKRYKDKLDQDANDFIGYAVDGANRMQKMIQSLLLYSRITRDNSPLQHVDCNTLLKDVNQNLQVKIQESGAEIQSDPLPTIVGYPMLLIQLFQNLIGNAIKFQKGTTPVVSITVQKNDLLWLFAVKDNGIGIDPQQFENIFVIFNRLSTFDEYPGTGIGLSICKKIVERHNGSIWVESEPNHGTTFYFTISCKLKVQ